MKSYILGMHCRKCKIDTEIKYTKGDRNLLIHGLWKEPVQFQNDAEVLYEVRKIKYTEQKTNTGLTKIWTHNTFKKYKLSYVKRLIVKINDIIIAQEQILRLQEES